MGRADMRKESRQIGFSQQRTTCTGAPLRQRALGHGRGFTARHCGCSGHRSTGCPMSPPSVLLLLLGAALARAAVVTVEIPEALFDGDLETNAHKYCRQNKLGPTPEGIACADAVLSDAGATLRQRSLDRAAVGDADGSVDDARRRVNASPSSDAFRQYGLALVERGQKKDASDAVEALRQAVAADPADLGAVHGLKRAAHAARPPADLRVVTFASDLEVCGLRRLLASGAGHGVTIDVLGTNRSWSNGLKLMLLRDFCRGLDQRTLVVAVDGYDVIVAGSLNQVRTRLEQLLERHPGAVVASADQTFYFRGEGEQCFGRHYPDPTQPYRFLNSGGLAGAAADLAAVADRALSAAGGWDGVSDQTLLHKQFVAEAQDCIGGARTVCGARIPCAARTLAVDHRQELFGNTGGRAFLRDFDVAGGRLHNTVTDTLPLFLHCPGDRRFRAEFDRLAQLGLPAIEPCGDAGAVGP